MEMAQLTARPRLTVRRTTGERKRSIDTRKRLRIVTRSRTSTLLFAKLAFRVVEEATGAIAAAPIDDNIFAIVVPVVVALAVAFPASVVERGGAACMHVRVHVRVRD